MKFFDVIKRKLKIDEGKPSLPQKEDIPPQENDSPQKPHSPQTDKPKENDLEDLLEKKKSKIKKLERRLKELEDELQSVEGRNKDLKKEIRDLKEKKEELEETIGQKDRKIKTLEGEKKDLEEAKEELEEENEGLKDEVEDLEEEIKQKKEEFRAEKAQMHDEIRGLKNQNRQLEVEIEAKDEQIDDQGIDIQQKKNTLDFIGEVLNSKEEESADIESLYRNVESLVEHVRGNFLECVKTSFPQVKEIEKEALLTTELLQWEQVVKKSWIYNKKIIAFVGEFSAGKTTIVNNILSYHNPKAITLPVKTEATTAIATYISASCGGNASTPSYQFFTPDNKLKRLPEESFKSISKDILKQVRGASSLIKYFVMSSPHTQLQGLSILDTPGFSSNDEEDSRRTMEVVNECDALFWIVDINAGTLNRSSLKIIKENLEKPLYVVLNKGDSKSPSEKKAVEKLIRKTLEREELVFEEIIHYSQSEPIEKILEVFEMVEKGNSDSFLEKLKTYAEEFLEKKKEERKEQIKKVSEILGEVEEGAADISKTISSIQTKNKDAASIPQHCNPVFGRNYYWMETDEYTSLKTCLQKACDSGDLLKTLFEKNKEDYSNYQAARSKKDQLKNEFVNLEKSVQQLYEKIKKIEESR